MKSEKGIILCVEDDRDVLKAYDLLFSQHNYTVISAKDGLEALELFRKNKGSLVGILTDIRMPRLNGIELAKEIRKQNTEIPIIAVSAYLKTHDSIRKCEEAGINAYTQKPFEASNLVKMFKEYIDKYIHRNDK